MEIEEIETDVDENQISFDFLNTPQTITKVENYQWVAEETLVVLVKANAGFSPDFEICGKKMLDWVALSCAGCKQKVIDDPGDDNILSAIKDFVQDYKFVVVLYSDTPLLKRQTFLEIMDYFCKHKINVLKLLRGYVFKADYVKSARMILSNYVEEFDKNDFLIVDSAEKVSKAFKVLNERILDYHKQRGVVLFGENTIFIDADVEIEEGCVIYPNNVLKGESYIGKSVILESGNYIIDTIICDEAFVCQSYLEKSKVGEGKIVGPYVKLVSKEF